MYGVTRENKVAAFKPGDRVVWYDHRLWGPRDIGNNEHCRKPGTVVGIGHDELGQTIDILFDHNPNVSHGHFAYPPFLGSVISRRVPGGHCESTTECRQTCLCGCDGCMQERDEGVILA